MVEECITFKIMNSMLHRICARVVLYSKKPTPTVRSNALPTRISYQFISLFILPKIIFELDSTFIASRPVLSQLRQRSRGQRRKVALLTCVPPFNDLPDSYRLVWSGHDNGLETATTRRMKNGTLIVLNYENVSVGF